MSYYSKLFFLTAGIFSLTACEKAAELPYYPEGEPARLSASATHIAPSPADSNQVAVVFTWTFPKYALDSLKVKYILQIDKAGGGFVQPFMKEIIGDLKGELLAKEINAIALEQGFLFGETYDMESRLISSYPNNNEQRISNTFSFKVTPYKVPPKVKLPESGRLFIVGNATAGDWNENPPIPQQEFSRIDETTFAGVFELIGANQFIILPERGQWSNKYSVANTHAPGGAEGGDFGYELSDNFLAPEISGWYKIILNFQTGKYSIIPYEGLIPEKLFIVGNATPGGWDNPVPVPSQELTRMNSSQFEITLPLNNNSYYLFLPVNGSWENKYAVTDNAIPGINMGGELGYKFNDDIPSPAESGNYKIMINFAEGIQGRFKLVKH